MTIWRLILMIVSAYFTHRKGMKQLRTARLHHTAIDGILTAYRNGDYQSALHIAESMKGDPTLADSYFFFTGTMMMNLGRFQEAERRLRQNLTVVPDEKRRALAHSSLGQLLLELQRYDEALECFHTSLQYWPDRGSSHRDLAEACLRKGGHADAVKWARLAVQEDRDQLETSNSPALEDVANINLAEDLSTLAWAVAADSGDSAQVDRLVNEAESLSFTAASPKAQVQCHAGRAYLALGDSVRSEHHFSEAARIDPNGLWGRAGQAMSATGVNA